jgi:hypothetical protein
MVGEKDYGIVSQKVFTLAHQHNHQNYNHHQKCIPLYKQLGERVSKKISNFLYSKLLIFTYKNGWDRNFVAYTANCLYPSCL